MYEINSSSSYVSDQDSLSENKICMVNESNFYMSLSPPSDEITIIEDKD